MSIAATKQRLMRSPGPVADAFMRSRAFIAIIIGPVGSGKTMAALQKGMRVAAQQKGVADAHGIVRHKARIGIIRESYPSLKSTTLKSWFNIVPESEGKFTWSAPFTHKFQKVVRRDAAGRVAAVLEVEFEFRAIGDQSVEEACRGWEVNAVIVDEGDLQPADLVPFLTGRVGRFSDLDASLVVDPQIIISSNMPDIDNHLYALAYENALGEMGDEDKAALAEALGDRPLIETFTQPGGMAADAENLHNLPGGRGYYVLQVAANKHKQNYVDRMVHNKPVPLMHGKPVNADFSHREHVGAVAWDRRFKLIVGVDQGQYAAAVMLYRNEMAQIRTVGECVNVAKDGRSQIKVSAAGFGKMLRNYLLERWPDLRADDIRVVGDPAMFAASDKPEGEYDWRLAFQKALGFPVHRARSNKEALRQEAIWEAQTERGGYQVDPACRTLIRAHSGGYRYAKETLQTGETRGQLTVAETFYHNIADAEQYAALEGEHVINDLRGRPRRTATVTVESDFDEFRGV